MGGMSQLSYRPGAPPHCRMQQKHCSQEPAYFMDRPEMVVNRSAAEKVMSQLHAGLEMETNFRLNEDDKVPRLVTT